MCCMIVDITKGIVMTFEAEQVNHYFKEAALHEGSFFYKCVYIYIEREKLV